MQRILFLETWRWCFFFAGFVPIHYVSEGAVRVAEMIVESKLFTVQQALYFAVSIHVSKSGLGNVCSIAANLLSCSKSETHVTHTEEQHV